MAVDTRNKRGAIIGLGISLVLPLPDSSVVAADRQQVTHQYPGIAASAIVAADPVGGAELDSVESATYYEILEPKKAKKKIKVIRKVIRKKRVEQKAKPKEFDSSKIQELQSQYKQLTALYAQVQKSNIKRESDQAIRSKVEAQKQYEKLQLEYIEQQEYEQEQDDETVMLELITQLL